jgi:hypothetical protein
MCSPAEGRLQGVGVIDVEFVLDADDHLKALARHRLNHLPEHVAGGSALRFAIDAPALADQPGRGGRPGDEGGSGEVGKEHLVGVAGLLVVQRAAHHLALAVQHHGTAVEVQAARGKARRFAQRDRLNPGGAMQVGQLEADLLDALAAPELE